jgi:hypothetical protein
MNLGNRAILQWQVRTELQPLNNVMDMSHGSARIASGQEKTTARQDRAGIPSGRAWFEIPDSEVMVGREVGEVTEVMVG